MNNEVIIQNQLTVTNDCFHCLQLNELCPDCLDSKEAHDAEVAWEIVDEGNERYVKIPSKKVIMPSGHDWTERLSEFKEQVVDMADRIYDLDESITLTASEAICDSCHYVVNRFAVCPNCN